MTPALTKLESLPQQPGVYRFIHRLGHTLYVGKAKSLRDRVRSYFRPGAELSPHIARMVGEVDDLDVIVVHTEIEALILESNLIKRERPRYNVVLRDDKSFPHLKLSVRDAFPRASLVRRARSDGAFYVGPFLPASNARRTLKLVQRQFRVATCREVFDGKRRPCLYYHLGQCLAPCAGRTTREEYAVAVEHVRLFLEGRHADLQRALEARMRRASQEREYERAAAHRDTLRVVQALAVRQRMATVGQEEQDYFAHHAEGDRVALQVFQVREGRVQGRRQFTLEVPGFEPAQFYGAVLPQYYAETAPPREIYVPLPPAERELLLGALVERRGARVELRVAQRGPRRRLASLVEQNARMAFEARFRAPEQGSQAARALAQALGLEEAPERIECFDVSNIQGSDSVVSLVVWENGREVKADYRQFGVREVSGPDDYASIAEAVTRRYRRRLAEDGPLPDLVLIDGGRGQLGVAVAALARVGLPMLPVAALAKREEELHVQGRDEPLLLDRRSPALMLLQRLRDEAHRFALRRHREKRSRRTLRTELTSIPGVGRARARRLLSHFGSLAGVRAARPEALAQVLGPALAAVVAGALHSAGRARET
jgi:excinuclease ABC subunit C